MKKYFVIPVIAIVLGLCANICEAIDGATIQKLPNSSYSKLCYRGKCALYDDFDDEMVTALQYDDIALIDETPYAKVKVKDKWALYYLYSDIELTLPEYDDISTLKINGGHYVAVKKNDKWAIAYAVKPKLLTGYMYDDFIRVDNDWDYDIYKVKSFGKTGYIYMDIRNPEYCNFDYVPAIYDDAAKLNEDIYKVKETDKWAVYKVSAKKTVTLFVYDDITYRNDKLQGLQNGTWVDIE